MSVLLKLSVPFPTYSQYNASDFDKKSLSHNNLHFYCLYAFCVYLTFSHREVDPSLFEVGLFPSPVLCLDPQFSGLKILFSFLLRWFVPW